jgi:3,4-dihydroxy 2-butanone 4-phosphate synthase/GTP cyclohydrolase II
MCPIGDPFRGRPDLFAALDAIDRAPAGVFLYVFNKARTSLARSFSRQVNGTATEVSAQGAARSSAQSEALRDFGLGAQVLADLGCRKIRLISNADRRIVGIEGFGIEVVERLPLPQLAGARVVPLAGARGEKA